MNTRKRSALLALIIAFVGPAVLLFGTWFLFLKADRVHIAPPMFILMLFGVIFSGCVLWLIGELVKPKNEGRTISSAYPGLEPENALVRSFRVLMPWKSVTYYELARLNGALYGVICFGLIENPSIWMSGIFLVILCVVIICAFSFYKQQTANPGITS